MLQMLDLPVRKWSVVEPLAWINRVKSNGQKL